MTVASGKLFVCGTPIGNLEDISLRVIRVLKEVDLIAAEDTRKTRGLLNYYQINTPLISYHEHNEIQRGKELLWKLKNGQRIALVSEAGMPGISDPGFRLIRSCLEEKIPVEVVPGPSAAISALVISGLPTHRFAFEGFLPRKKGERERILTEIKEEKRTLIFYESPHRVERTLSSLQKFLGERRMVLARELTKKFEEVRRGTIEEVLQSVKNNPPKGEIVLVVEGAKRVKSEVDEESLKEEVLAEMKKGLNKKEAIKVVAQRQGVSKRQVYEAAKTIHPPPRDG